MEMEDVTDVNRLLILVLFFLSLPAALIIQIYFCCFAFAFINTRSVGFQVGDWLVRQFFVDLRVTALHDGILVQKAYTG